MFLFLTSNVHLETSHAGENIVLTNSLGSICIFFPVQTTVFTGGFVMFRKT